MNSKKIVVFGDIMLDIWNYCTTSRLSPEAPIPVNKIIKTEYQLGGAANVAYILSKANVAVTLVGFIGSDLTGKKIFSLLKKYKISFNIKILQNYHSIKKERYLTNNIQTSRLDHDEDYSPISKRLINQQTLKLIKNADIIILSDYLKGTLFNIQEIIKICKENKKKVILDPKSKDMQIYSGVDILKPNYQELKNYLGSFDDKNYKAQCFNLVKKLNLKYLVVTKGKDGIDLFESNSNFENFSQNVKDIIDVTGAGDVVCSVLCLGLLMDLDIKQSLSLAGFAATESLSKIGTVNIDLCAIYKNYILKNLKLMQNKKFDLKGLSKFLTLSKIFGIKIVFVNGCFDILHPGHLDLLKTAKSKGDILVVGLNSDISIKKNKGKNRPINKIDYRLKMLSHIVYVDAICVFNEITPINLIKIIKPNILVKGSDYKFNEIVGSEYIRSYGGKILRYKITDTYSTSNLISHIIKKYN